MSENSGYQHGVSGTADIEAELYREKYKNRYRKLLRNTAYTLIVVAAISVLIATIFLPVFQIYGTSMTPTLTEGDIVFSVKRGHFKRGDIVAFYYNNRILVKRVVGFSGETVIIDKDGNVYIDDVLLDEPYLVEKAKGDGDLEYPYIIPEHSYFLLGDHRATSVDSRSSSIGCVDADEIVGKILFAVWPLPHFGRVK